ncbi:MAG: hypothetical protein A2W72_15520 [Burkholderiales bacterium RIFCSPLOWO2_12_67_14]|nr:MAG: hypothetical protein A2W72_15520 [Burkholderiales bacterium RIFCSPLOWO2_12_67_14]
MNTVRSPLQAQIVQWLVASGDAVQALCFVAGANSIFYGDKLLTTGNPDVDRDRELLGRLGLKTRHTFGG